MVQKMKRIRKFLQDGQGQDLIEYTLLLAFVALASAGLYTSAGGSVSNIWGNANGNLAMASDCAVGGNACAVEEAVQACISNGHPNFQINGPATGTQTVTCN
jgi:Flp pilus assembly pilin Flp